MLKTELVHTDVRLSQAQNVQEFGWLLHLPGEVVQLSFHRQQAVRERLPELFWVRHIHLLSVLHTSKCLEAFFFFFFSSLLRNCFVWQVERNKIWRNL